MTSMTTSMTTTRKFTVHEWIAGSEPCLLSLVEDASTAFVGDTERAHQVAQQAGIEREERGRYAPVVWMIVFS
jgi:hypothetical protein